MKTGTVLLIAGAAFVGYEFLQLGQSINTVQFQIVGFNIISFTDYRIQVLVQNVGNANANLNALTGTVSINGNQIGNLSDFTAINISPRSQQVVNVELQPNLLQIPSAVQQLINNPGSTFNINISGNANVNTLVVPFSVDQTISV